MEVSKRNRIIYLASTGLFSLVMLFSSMMYIFNHDEVQSVFTAMGFPVFLIYPMAAAKLLGLIAVWTRKSRVLTEWAYAGFFFNTLLAIGAHVNIADGEAGAAAVACVLVLVSYNFKPKDA